MTIADEGQISDEAMVEFLANEKDVYDDAAAAPAAAASANDAVRITKKAASKKRRTLQMRR